MVPNQVPDRVHFGAPRRSTVRQRTAKTHVFQHVAVTCDLAHVEISDFKSCASASFATLACLEAPSLSQVCKVPVAPHCCYEPSGYNARMDRDVLRFLLYVVVGIALFVLLVRWSLNENVLDYFYF